MATNDANWKPRSAKKLHRMLGPGLVTGAADDDPSGIATYSQSGAQFGYALCWTMFLTTPFMVAIQIVSARIGSVTGRGLAANLRQDAARQSRFTPWLGYCSPPTCSTLPPILRRWPPRYGFSSADPRPVYMRLASASSVSPREILIPYRTYSRYLEILTLVLFAYVATAFSIHVPWGEVLAATLLPHFSWDRDLHPDAGGGAAARRSVRICSFGRPRSKWRNAASKRRTRGRRGRRPTNRLGAKQRFQPIVIDTWVGMAAVQRHRLLHHRRHRSDVARAWHHTHRHGRRRGGSTAAAGRAACVSCCSRSGSSAPDCWPFRRSPALPATRSQRPSAGRTASA